MDQSSMMEKEIAEKDIICMQIFKYLIQQQEKYLENINQFVFGVGLIR